MAEHLPEQLVVPEPVPLPVQGYQEKVGCLQSLQNGSRSAHSCNRVAQRARQLIEHGCPCQETIIIRWQTVEKLRAHVVGDQAIVATERLLRTPAEALRDVRKR